MQMIVTIAGDPLVIMHMSSFNCKVGPGSYTIIVLMTVIEGYITYKSVGVVCQVVFFTGYPGHSMTMLMG